MPHCQSMDEATVVVWVMYNFAGFPMTSFPPLPHPLLHSISPFPPPFVHMHSPRPSILSPLSLPPPYIRLPSSTSPFSPATDRVQQCVTGSTGQGGGASNHLDPTHLNLLSCYSVSCPLLTEDEESGNLYSATCVFYRGTITKTMTIIYST